MQKFYKCINVNGADAITEGKVYEGSVSNGGAYLQFKNDCGRKDMLFLHRFSEVNDRDAVTLLEARLKEVKAQAEKDREELQAQINTLRESFNITRGSRWLSRDGEEYIIAVVDDGRFSAICLEDGLRWTDSVKDIADVFGKNHTFKRI